MGRLSKEKKRSAAVDAPGGQPKRVAKQTPPNSAGIGATTNTKPANAKRVKETNAPTTTTSAKKPRTQENLEAGPDKKGGESENVDAPSAGKEDAALVDTYKEQMLPLLKLDAEKSDDQSIAAWVKTRTKQVADLKACIASKKKSLRRRTSDTTWLFAELDELTSSLTSFTTLLKMLGTGASEGSDVYRAIVDRVEKDKATVFDAVWERALRAVAFEDRDFMPVNQCIGQTQKM